MRNICNINFSDMSGWGSFNSATTENELIVEILPLETQKTGYKVEVTGSNSRFVTSEIIEAVNGLVYYTIPFSYYSFAGTMKVRLLSNEGNSEQINFNIPTALKASDNIQAKYNEDEEQFKITAVLSSAILDKTYPIGSVYMSVNSTNPSQLFGGTWEQIKGRMLVGVNESDSDFNTPKKTGGEKTHKLTQQELPSHNHGLIGHAFNWGSNYGTVYNSLGDATAGQKGSGNPLATIQGQSDKTRSVGGGQAHNNMPPYYTVYMWVRTA